jgi:hypothetical protein
MHVRTQLLLIALIVSLAGCHHLEKSHQPVIHNPFPQLRRIAIAPFFNFSTERTVDGRQFALAYYAALQQTAGYEVIPIGVTEETMESEGIDLNSPSDARRLAQVLGADAVVIGAITDFTPYYPPRCAMKVEWFAANPFFHPIPPGYGLPWGTPEEEQIPAPLVFEAEMALAREQLKTKTPPFAPESDEIPVNREGDPESPDGWHPKGQLISHQEASESPEDVAAIESADSDGRPPWPDARGFIPPGPNCFDGPYSPSDRPVLEHTRMFDGSDSDFTLALASYYNFRDDVRFGGWKAYLDRSDDFIRFCCYMHICEMLSARGGAGETRVVWRWSHNR